MRWGEKERGGSHMWRLAAGFSRSWCDVRNLNQTCIITNKSLRNTLTCRRKNEETERLTCRSPNSDFK